MGEVSLCFTVFPYAVTLGRAERDSYVQEPTVSSDDCGRATGESGGSGCITQPFAAKGEVEIAHPACLCVCVCPRKKAAF